MDNIMQSQFINPYKAFSEEYCKSMQSVELSTNVQY